MADYETIRINVPGNLAEAIRRAVVSRTALNYPNANFAELVIVAIQAELVHDRISLEYLS